MTTNYDVIAVFPSERATRAAVRALAERGVAEERISIDDPDTERAALRGEMRDELEHGIVAPQAGLVMTEEMAAGAAIAVPVAALIGAALAFPLGFIHMGTLPLWARLLIAVGVGAVAGSVVGVIVGAGAAARGPAEPLPAEKGVSLRVRDADAAIVELLATHDPLRVYVVTPDGVPEASLSDPDLSVPEAGRRVAARMDQGSGDWSRVPGNSAQRRPGSGRGRTRPARPASRQQSQ
jgi:hypothetical protein